MMIVRQRWVQVVLPAAFAAAAVIGGCSSSDGAVAGAGAGGASAGAGQPPVTAGAAGTGGVAQGGGTGAGTGGVAPDGSTAAGGSMTGGGAGAGGTVLDGASGTGGAGGTAGAGGTPDAGRPMSEAGAPIADGSAGDGGISGTGRLRPSANGRYLEWSNGTPIFLLSDTAWLLPARYTQAEVASHAMTRASQGFTAIQMTASFPENDNQLLATVFTGGDFTVPVAAYWTALDAKIQQITDDGLVVILNPFWKKTSDATIASNGVTKCRTYGKWLGTRYRNNARVIYFLGGDATPATVSAELDAMGLGIQDAYTEAALPKAIVAYHGAPGRTSREEWPTSPAWLTLDWTYAYSLPLGAAIPYQKNWTDWPKASPLPIMFGEGWYDRDNGATTTSRFGNRQMVRRQLWWNPLSGAIAGTAYGAEPIWLHGYGGFTPAQAVLWNSGLDAGRMRRFLYTTQWWRLQPDLNGSFITAGNGTAGAVDYAVGALADDGSFGLVYTPIARNLTLKMPAGHDSTLRWFDPTDGTYRAGSVAGASGASVVMTHPGNNASGAADWVIHVASAVP